MAECVAKGFGTDMGHGYGMPWQWDGRKTGGATLDMGEDFRLYDEEFRWFVDWSSCTQELATPAPHLHPVCREYKWEVE